MLLTLFGKIVYSTDAVGEPISQELPVSDMPPGEYGLVFIKMFLTLVVLILLIAGSFWFLRRLLKTRASRSFGEQKIYILEKRMISPKSMLFLVEVEGQKILLAESQHEIRRLQNWPQPSENLKDAIQESFNVP